MKKIFLIALTAMSSTVFAQTEIANIPLDDKYLQGIQTIDLGDTLFVSIDEGVKSNNLLIMPDGTQRMFDAPLLHGKVILHAENFGDSILFYYGEGKKKAVVLKTLSWNATTNTSRLLPWTYDLNSRVWASYKNDGVHLLCGDKNSDTLEIISIRRLTTSSTKVHLPVQLFERANQSTALFPDGEEVMPSQAAAKAKVYVKDSSLLISHFKQGLKTSEQTIYATNTLIKIDLKTGKSETLAMKDPINNYFGMFVHNDLIYKIIKGFKTFTIEIYRWDKKLVKSFTLNKQTEFSKQSAYLRDDRARRIFDNRTVFDAIANGGDEFISVHTGADGDLILKVGTNVEFIESSPMIRLFGPVVFALTAVTSVVVMTTSNTDQFADHYFYLKGNVNDGFTYTEQSGLVQQSVDEAELADERKEVYYKYKWYLRTSKGVYAYLVPKKGKPTLKIVKYIR